MPLGFVCVLVVFGFGHCMGLGRGGEQVNYIVIWGNAVDGHKFVGPFDSYEEAVEWANDCLGFFWYIADLQQPD